jgi:hypothetical protein
VRDFESHPVVRIVETAVTLFITSIELVRPNQHYHYLAFGKTLFKHGRKVNARGHVNIDKYVLAAKLVFQILADAKRIGSAVVTPIAYENLVRHAGGVWVALLEGCRLPNEAIRNCTYSLPQD